MVKPVDGLPYIIVYVLFTDAKVKFAGFVIKTVNSCGLAKNLSFGLETVSIPIS
jgi:hypothetical protein